MTRHAAGIMEPIAQADVRLQAREFAFATLLVSLRRFRWLLGFWAAIGVGTLLLAMPPRTETSPTEMSVVTVLATLFAFIGAIAVSALLRFRSLPASQTEYKWSFYPGHIDAVSSVATARLDWSLFVEVREIGQSFLFFPQRDMCHIIPKRSFARPSEIKAIRAVCRDRLGPKAHVGRDKAG